MVTYEQLELPFSAYEDWDWSSGQLGEEADFGSTDGEDMFADEFVSDWVAPKAECT